MLLFEQLIGRVSVTFGVGEMLLDPGNFLPEKLDPLTQLIDRQWAEILANEQGQRVAGLAREEIIFIHDCSQR